MFTEPLMYSRFGKLFFFLSFGSWSLMDFVVVITFA